VIEERLLQLLAINRAIVDTLDYEKVLELVVAKTAELARARACALLLADDDGIARVVASRGIPDALAFTFAAPLDERINVALRALLSYRDEDTFIGVPVIHAGQVRGILVVHREGTAPADPDEELVLGALADQAAIALDHASRYRELWEESQAARQELETAGRRKDEFLAMLSHELRNPLAAIANAHAVLRLALTRDARLQRVHDIADRQTAHMKRLLDDLLDVSRVTQDKIDLERRPVRLQDVVQQAVLATQSLIDERHHELVLEVPDEPLVASVDRDRMVQVVSNLLTNAAKFTPPGGHVWLSLHREGGDAVVRVRDDGIGIREDLLPSVFDLFVQAERPAARTEGGLGIGLALVRRLVEMHGGMVQAKSDGSGRGSEFVVTLPASADGLPAEPSRPATAPAPRVVLLVEDNPDVADLLAEALAQLGHEVTVARDGEAALAEVERKSWEVVLVDIGLPGIDGFELVRQLRRRPLERQPLVVALTGYGSADDREKARQAGFDHHLVKPVHLEQLNRLLSAPLH